MKKNIIKQSISLAIASSLSYTICADDNTIVITANQMEQDINDTLTDIVVIERNDIEGIQPQSLNDLLVNIPGIDIVQQGGEGKKTSTFVRGSNSNHVLILIDGVRVGSATLGAKSVAYISISQIERIEIVKGPRAALWGSDAIGGVIQIFTRRYQSGENRVALTFGSNATQDLDASIGFGTQRLSNTLTFGHKKTDGFDAFQDSENDRDGYENNSLAIRGDYQLSETSTIDWVAQADEGETEFDSTWGNISNYNNYLWNIRYNHHSDNWKNHFSTSSSRDHNITFGNGITKAAAGVFETQRQQFNYLTNNRYNDELSLGGGLEWLEDNVEKSTTRYTVTKRTTKSAFINANYIDDAFLAELAVRYDDVENIADNTALNIGLGYRINEQHQLSINYGEGFKAPTFNDLYYPWGGNEDLKFETSNNKEFIYKGFYETSHMVVSVYDSDIENMIQWVTDNSGNWWTPENVGAKITGIDWSINWQTDDYQHKFSASYVDTKDATTDTQLIRRARQHLGYDISFSGESFDWFVQLQHTGKRPDTDVMHKSYTQINFAASYSFNENWQLKLKVSDALDKAATVVSGYNVAGRTFYLTVVHKNLL